MAIIGSTIGAAFAVSFVAAPSLEQAIGDARHLRRHRRAGAGGDGLGARWVVPERADVGRTTPARSPSLAVLRQPELVRLNVGIFSLHAVLMAMFVVVPFALVATRDLPAASTGRCTWAPMVAGVVLMVPARGEPQGPRGARRCSSAAIAVVGTGWPRSPSASAIWR